MSAVEPGNSLLAVTPSDTVNLPRMARAIYVGVAGDVSILPRDGAAVVFAACPVGTILPIWTRRVNATGTTASSLTAIF